MKILIFLISCFGISSIITEFSPISATKKSIAILQEISKNEVAIEWGAKLGNQIPKIAKLSQKFGKYAGPIGEVISFALTIAEEQQAQTEDYLKNITQQLDKIDSKLDALSEQITQLNQFISSKIEHSTNKIITEVKFRDYFQYYEDLAAFKQHFESIIYSFTSNTTSLVVQLDNYIQDFRRKGSDTKLINSLDSGAGLSKSIVEDLITLTRSYYNEQFNTPSSSTMKTIFDVYITAFMAVLKSNIILESAVNMKEAITGDNYKEDRRYNQYRRNEIYAKFFASLEKTFQKLTDNDLDGFYDFKINGNHNAVRLTNVLQYFWENEDKLSKIDTCSDDCEHFKDRSYYGAGCDGGVKDCKFGVSMHHEERYLRQRPQVDRIYEGYVLNSKWYGQGYDDDVRQEMEHKKSYRRGFYSCHVCKCICDQYSNSNSIRKIYTGKISAPTDYVVTGVKFIERNKIIYPQIQVGKLLPMAMIDQRSVKWLDIPNDNYYVTFDYDKHSIGFGDPSSLTFANGVVTGVQFKNTNFGASWSIYGRKLEDTNRGIMGDELHLESSPWLNSFDAYNLIPGLKSGSTAFSIRKSLKVTFGISNEDRDAGQSFVPYFDGTEISFDIKSPLSGITLIQYTDDSSFAGYIRPVLRSLDYRKNFDTSYQADEFVSQF